VRSHTRIVAFDYLVGLLAGGEFPRPAVADDSTPTAHRVGTAGG
jgi:hypothetical protein